MSVSMDGLKNAFKGFDPNDMDINSAGNWPVGIKAIVYLLLFSAIIGAGIYFLILDKHKSVEREIVKERELKQQFESKAFQVANLAALRKQMADVEGRFAELLKQLPTDKEVPGLLEDITAIGKSAGLDIDTIALQAERKAQFYVELPISIQVRGTYHQMGEFVSGVAAIKRIVTLHDYSLKPSGSGQLTMNISAKTYRYDDTK
ncbi:type 4 fimbrial biogenesis protein PilO [Marinobacterium zhoushanense]|uniref:Type 4 fimbrial biogenesis protein PilO n=1 Tax=Marinobacterium zhoushanense TaxID=1679163 RepID=A0ABQ1KI70_9GAMM|nr:type 4a pilus biogenesis protein PilO [Marinobacterium zhoushanense]GGB98394.1 type 4 fimbrial biogenesis protein PilO [Marinobacterium zhoushanense]